MELPNFVQCHMLIHIMFTDPNVSLADDKPGDGSNEKCDWIHSKNAQTN